MQLSLTQFYPISVCVQSSNVSSCTGMNLKDEEWVDSAQDRDYWRALVDVALNLRIPYARKLVCNSIDTCVSEPTNCVFICSIGCFRLLGYGSVPGAHHNAVRVPCRACFVSPSQPGLLPLPSVHLFFSPLR